MTPLLSHYYPCLYKTWSGILVDYVIAQSLYDFVTINIYFVPFQQSNKS
jgi:hypothetical protein